MNTETPPRPTSLRIIGKTYTVEGYPADLTHSDKVGRCNLDTCRIAVRDGQAPDQERDTVIHEAIHAIDASMLLELTEQQTHAFSAGVYALLQDNPGLVRWLMVGVED